MYSAFQLDKSRGWVLHPVMVWKASFVVTSVGGQIRLAAARAAGCLSVCSLVIGCSLSPLSKHTVAFSNATGTVIDNSEDAYRAAIKLRHDEQVAVAVYAYDKDPNWSPYKDMKPLLTPGAVAGSHHGPRRPQSLRQLPCRTYRQTLGQGYGGA